MASQDKRPGEGFDVSLLEGLRERVCQDQQSEDDYLPARSARKSLLFGALIGLAVAAGAAWYILGSGGSPKTAGPREVPVVKSEKAPVKVRPADPGGMEVPNQDKMVYDRVGKGAAKPEVEHLLPQPASPKDLPKSGDALGDGMAPLPPPLPEVAKPVETAKVPPPMAAPAKPAEPAKPAAVPLAKVETVKPAAPAPAASEKITATGAWQVQLAALKEESRAKSEWTRAMKVAPAILGNLPHEVVRADLGAKGVFYRLRAGGFAAREQAEQVCESLKAKGIGCVVAKR